ncbi:unnamed protein product [Didymodactylos carnosus]|uniref:Reverse transcriptase domain-containing protein n=1 Tax=Didymodactylos carnosus TaxID=1234261 RepID=A0A815RSG3_9BILA|nr:unnamed protein product [Didymodactylos carnosus]CAF1480696.1 unnamed protein product [Didymodactylos carnosus]CAF4020743.1 unnamed protein product [Didymodactylos carnosus]CAF4345828.1 unnamed protein product [Didymodactylos carnosus]
MYFTKFDFKSGYFQIPLAKGDRPKTAFSTRDNHHQFTVLPQGVTNGPATFQRIINHILGSTRWRYALAYIDDIIVYSRTFEEHLSHLNEICQLLKQTKFRLNASECEVARTETHYLGHYIKQGDIRPSPDNIRGLVHTQISSTAEEACKFLKAAEYYLGYLSKKFTPTQRRWFATEQECYALMCSLDKWHNYLSGTKFIWETDHKSPLPLSKKSQTNKKCERWRLKIAEYDFDVRHIHGIQNSMPDYLSRYPVDDAEEDRDDVIPTSSNSTQTYDELNPEVSSIVAAVQTRSATRQSASHNPSTKITSLQTTEKTMSLDSTNYWPH